MSDFLSAFARRICSLRAADDFAGLGAGLSSADGKEDSTGLSIFGFGAPPRRANLDTGGFWGARARAAGFDADLDAPISLGINFEPSVCCTDGLGSPPPARSPFSDALGFNPSVFGRAGSPVFGLGKPEGASVATLFASLSFGVIDATGWRGLPNADDGREVIGLSGWKKLDRRLLRGVGVTFARLSMVRSESEGLEAFFVGGVDGGRSTSSNTV